MAAARRRMVHLWLMLAAVLAFVVGNMRPSEMTRSQLIGAGMWLVVALALLAGGWAYVRSRHRATYRLLSLARSGTLDLASVERSRVELFGMMTGFHGHEVVVRLRDGESLAFGFWKQETADRLARALERPPTDG